MGHGPKFGQSGYEGKGDGDGFGDRAPLEIDVIDDGKKSWAMGSAVNKPIAFTLTFGIMTAAHLIHLMMRTNKISTNKALHNFR